MSTKDKIIVALDVKSCDRALSLVESLDGHANFFKIGLGLIGKGGLELASKMKKRGLHVFLDLKFSFIAINNPLIKSVIKIVFKNLLIFI